MTSLVKLARLLLVVVAVAGLAACSPVRWLVVNSDGILTYNRHTGQLELLWEHHSEKSDWPTQSVAADSICSHDPAPAIIPMK